LNEDQVKLLIENALDEHSLIAWKEIILKLLESPVVLVILVGIVLFLSRTKIAGFIKNRNIEIGWGDKNIKLSELSTSIDQELDPLREEIESLKNEINSLKSEGVSPEETSVVDITDENELKRIKDRIHMALGSTKFKWRSIEQLAKLSRANEKQVLELIASDNTIQVGHDKSGKKLAKFIHR